MNPQDLKRLIETTLNIMGTKYSTKEAIDLLMLTAAQESHCGEYLFQIGGGPARGIFQMEPDTVQDLYENYFPRKPALYKTIIDFSCGRFLDLDMICNIAYQIAMARANYWRVSEPLPKKDAYGDKLEYVLKLATYWKKHWNTELGSGRIHDAVQNYYRLVLNKMKSTTRRRNHG